MADFLGGKFVTYHHQRFLYSFIITISSDGFGVIGVAPEVELIHVKVLSDAGSGAFNWILQGIYYAADLGVDIINMSLGVVIPKSGGSNEGLNALKTTFCKSIQYA